MFEVDAYWARMGGADPAEVMTRLGSRAHYIHIKDGPAQSYTDDIMVPIGQGTIDWVATLRAGSSLDWHIVELERLSQDVFVALDQSLTYLVSTGCSRSSVELREGDA